MKKKVVSVISRGTFLLLLLLIASIGYGIFATVKYVQLQQQFYSKNSKIIEFENANSRDTYFTVHNIKAAHKLATGKDVKIGILDWNFGYDLESTLYKGTENFTDIPINEIREHGYWMAKVLREVVPDSVIYALNVMTRDQAEEDKAVAIIKAIDWAIDADIDILTYSGSRFTDKNEKLLDEAINRAVENGIVTTFLHCPNENNLLPTYMSRKDRAYDGREADVNIYGCDYNTLFVDRYLKVLSDKSMRSQEKDEILFGSASSTSPVAAGFVALMKELEPDLKPQEYKEILVKTSRSERNKGNEAPVIPDVYKALGELKKMQREDSSVS